MTEAECLQKCAKLLDNLKAKTLDECSRLYRSGGVDTGSPEYAGEENFLLPKILITAAWPFTVRNTTRPITESAKRAIKNLEQF